MSLFLNGIKMKIVDNTIIVVVTDQKIRGLPSDMLKYVYNGLLIFQLAYLVHYCRLYLKIHNLIYRLKYKIGDSLP